MTTYSNLHAVILVLMRNETLKNPSFEITGYDLTKYLKELGLNYSHQQLYRYLNQFPMLLRREVPQEGKPDKKLYRLKDRTPEGLARIPSVVNYEKTKPYLFLALADVDVVAKAFAHNQSHLVTAGKTVLEKFAAQQNRSTLKYLQKHLAKLVNDTQTDSTYGYLLAH